MRLITLLFLFLSTHSIAEDTFKSFTGLKTDIPIGDVNGITLRINIALPDNINTKPRPVLVYIHGGGLTKGDKNQFNKQITKMAKKGVVAASVMYRFAPQYRFPSAIADVKTAIRFLKAHAKEYNIDPDRIIVMGVSAGAYLAAMVGVTGNANGFSDNGLYPHINSSVRAVIAQSPAAADYTQAKYHNFSIVKRFANVNHVDKKSALVELSPITYLDKNDPPFFISHGSADELVPVEMSREFVAELKSISHEFEYIEVEGGKHSLKASKPKKASEVFSASMKFFKKHAFEK